MSPSHPTQNEICWDFARKRQQRFGVSAAFLLVPMEKRLASERGNAQHVGHSGRQGLRVGIQLARTARGCALGL
jgi:hypothetical protein